MRSETPDPWVRRSRSGRRCASLHCAPAPGDHAATIRAPGRYRATVCTSASRSMSQNSSRVYPRLSDSTASCRLTPLIALPRDERREDRKSTRLNSSHLVISYAVFCLKKKKKISVDRRPSPVWQTDETE